jgi:hypothetical protein
MFSGRCLCGNVTFEVEGPFGETAFCHCTSCRRASGSAFAVNAPVRVSQVRWPSGREAIGEFESSPGKLRAFCRGCGSPIYARLVREPDWLSIRPGLVEQGPGVRPCAHFNVSEKAPWLELSDDLPRHPGDTT